MNADEVAFRLTAPGREYSRRGAVGARGVGVAKGAKSAKVEQVVPNLLSRREGTTPESAR